ncbi:hypothetical protein HAX54_042235, partial [Datura stramonium]|nr:hypothetical protein [Datura stramonium]
VSWHQKLTKERKWISLTRVSSGFKKEQNDREAKHAPENWINRDCLTLEFHIIRDKVCELGLGYIFAKPKECILTLVREFYANWETFFGEITK